MEDEKQSRGIFGIIYIGFLLKAAGSMFYMMFWFPVFFSPPFQVEKIFMVLITILNLIIPILSCSRLTRAVREAKSNDSSGLTSIKTKKEILLFSSLDLIVLVVMFITLMAYNIGYFFSPYTIIAFIIVVIAEIMAFPIFFVFRSSGGESASFLMGEKYHVEENNDTLLKITIHPRSSPALNVLTLGLILIIVTAILITIAGISGQGNPRLPLIMLEAGVTGAFPTLFGIIFIILGLHTYYERTLVVDKDVGTFKIEDALTLVKKTRVKEFKLGEIASVAFGITGYMGWDFKASFEVDHDSFYQKSVDGPNFCIGLKLHEKHIQSNYFMLYFHKRGKTVIEIKELVERFLNGMIA